MCRLFNPFTEVFPMINKINTKICIFYCFTFLIITPVVNAHTLRNNDIFFSGIADSIAFIIKKHCVTKKQPSRIRDGSYLQATLDTYKYFYPYIVIQAGRSHSSKTVRCMTKNMLPKKIFVGDYFTFDHAPGSLNFAVQGSLIFNNKTVFSQIILAQGHNFFSNNWWFGGRYCSRFYPLKHYPQEAVTCTADNGEKWCFLRGVIASPSTNNYVNEITIYKEPCSVDLFKHM